MNQGYLGKGENPQQKFYFPQKKRDLNAMDVHRLMVDEHNKLLKEGRCFRCRKMGHQANTCPKDEEGQRSA
jgi:hypothetical protein